MARGPRFALTVLSDTSMPRNLAKWFIYAIVIAVFAAYVASLSLPAGAPYMTVFRVTSVVAFAGYHRDPMDRERAEVAFAIADRLHGRGIGTRVLERLADLARSAGVRVFNAYVLGGNHKMMECFLDSGYRTSRHTDNDVVHVELSLEPTLEHLERAAQRSQVAAAASMRSADMSAQA